MRTRVLMMLVLVAASGDIVGAQIMSGRGNRPIDPNTPTLPLDTNVSTGRPTFRTSVTRVEVSVLVTDASGAPVRGLGVEDFEVRDGGKKQAIASFHAYSRDASPIPLDTLPEDEAARAAVATNAWVSSSRLIGLLIDDLHIDPRHAERARAAARALIGKLAPSDYLFVGLTSAPTESTLGFTRDRRRALEIIRDFSGMRLLDPTLESRETTYWAGTDTVGALASEQQRAMRLADAYAALERVATAARSAPGRRKSLVFLSEGSSAGPATGSYAGQSVDTTGATLNALAAATMADVVVYPLNPAGLTVPTDRMIEGFTRWQDESGKQVAHVDLSKVIAEFLQAKNQLRDLAALTGGIPLVDHNDIGRAFDRVLHDASEYYILSYEPDKPAKGTKMRPIDVRVSRPGVRVRARRGYLPTPAQPAEASKDETLSPALRGLLGGAVPSDGLPMFVQAFPIAQHGDRVRYAIVAETAGAPLLPTITDGHLPIEQAMLSLDSKGRVKTVTHKRATLVVTPELAEAIGTLGVRTIWALDLDPGVHQLRVATVQPTSGLGGSLYVDVVAATDASPDPDALASLSTHPVPTAFIDPLVRELMVSPAMNR